MSCDEINNNTCGGSSSCCNSNSLIPCSSCGNTNGCSCGVGTPTPYYANGTGCQEDHTKLVIQNNYATSICTANVAVMPGCGLTTTLVFPGLQNIIVGSYLWNPAVGYLLVVSFDVLNGEVVVKNECQDGNAAPGTSISKCTCFTSVDTPVGVNNPCTEAAIGTGVLLVCNDGNAVPLAAASPGMIPIFTGTDNEVEMHTADLPVAVCTTLTVDITLLLGVAGPYTITVVDTSGFQLGDLIRINNRADRFSVTNVLGPTQFTAMVGPTPAGIEVIPAGVTVCLAPCCEQIENILNGIFAGNLTAYVGRLATNPYVTYNNTTNEVELFRGAIPANFLQLTRTARLRLPHIVIRNSTAGPIANNILKVYFGPIASLDVIAARTYTAPSAGAGDYHLAMKLESAISNVAVLNAQSNGSTLIIEDSILVTPLTKTFAIGATSADLLIARQTTAKDSTQVLYVIVTNTFSAADANLVVTFIGGSLELV